MSDASITGTLILPDFLIDIPGAPPRKGWGVRVVGEIIDAVAPWDVLTTDYPDDEQWRVPRQVLSPGFVDAHTHLTALLGHGGPDRPRADMLLRLDGEMVEAAVESALFHTISAGITAIGESLQAPCLLPGILGKVAALVESWGLRGTLSYQAGEEHSYEQGQAGLAENAELLERCRRKGFRHLSAYICADGSPNSSDALREEAEAMAWDAEARCLFHTASAIQQVIWIGGQGRVYTPLLDLRAQAESATWLVLQSETEQVALGSDGALFDFFRVMRSTRRQSRYERGHELLAPAAIWRLATSGGASVLGLKEVGQLRPGWQADLQTIDLTLPSPVNAGNLYEQLLRYGSSRSVQSVMVAGQVRVMNGIVLGVDAAAVRERSVAAARRLHEQAD